MPTQVCNNNKIIAQTLFLGASVASFNNSGGWGSQASNLTVNLIEDDAVCAIDSQFPSNRGFSTNHYYDCVEDDCYIKPDGSQFNNQNDDPSLRMVPGKIFYRTDPSFTNPIVSEYWYKSDPGFFGRKTRIKPDGTEDTSGNTYQYDIIDTPVYFKMGNFSFCGLVQSWTRNLSNSGKSYTVNINSLQSLLNSTYVIIDKYAGSIFSKLVNSDVGSPKNYLGQANVDYFGTISQGNIPNVFNVYGFLESMGVGNFGVARPTTEGISVNKIIKALTVLTSTITNGNTDELSLDNTAGIIPPFNIWADKNAFSPYGRIIAKNAQLENTYQSIANNFNGHGIIAPAPVPYNVTDNKCQFLLDLSDIPLLPDEFRISSPYISIGELLNSISEQSGYDFTIDCAPVVYDQKIYYIIKIKSISRLYQPRSNAIENNIKLFECNGYAISSDTIGKEKNETNARSLIVGGQQQRLYQTKSYRMAYSQSNMIFNPITKKFVNYMQMGSLGPEKNVITNISGKQYHHGKIKFPNFLTTRNPMLSSGYYATPYSNILDDEDALQTPFISDDTLWSDAQETVKSEDIPSTDTSRDIGNYDPTIVIKQQMEDTATLGVAVNQRWFPLYLDVICPFFGYVNEEELTININNNSSNSDFRKIRPVWLDTWTGQLAVVINLSELPELSVSLTADTTYIRNQPVTTQEFPIPAFPKTTTVKRSIQQTSPGPIQYCIITESEIRAALSGFDNFLVYSLAKLYKPDLIEILRKSHKNQIKNVLTRKGLTPIDAERIAEDKSDWYWNLFAPNIASKDNLEDIRPGVMSSDGGDGSQSIEEAALKDLQLLHKFISEIGKYYGKKYMVSAYNLQAYKDETFVNLELPTKIGSAYVFSGSGALKYNYTPTNDGAWEEYGNFIDDSIVVGSPEWYNLTDDVGKIKPILGYNANYHFDNVRYGLCRIDNAVVEKYKKKIKKQLAFNWEIYLELQSQLAISCNTTDFIFPSLETNNLESSNFILTSVINNIPTPIPASIDINNYKTFAFDAFGRKLAGLTGEPVYKQKLYLNTNVEENIVFLDPVNMLGPKILIDSPGIFFNSSSSKYVQDPSRTVLSNVSVEDLAIYLKITKKNNWDKNWINYMLQFSMPRYGTLDDLLALTEEEQAADSPANDDNSTSIDPDSAANRSALMVEIHPKAAHPFFAAIPIKSNQFTYGPWTNYPHKEELYNPGYIFPNGSNIIQDNNMPPSCTESIISIDSDTSKLAVNNWVSSVAIDFRDEFVPWNYGGTSILDTIAYKDIETKVNYQSIIETAQIEMPGLPLFNLGGNFIYTNIGLNNYSPNIVTLTYQDTKISSEAAFASLTISNPSQMMIPQSSKETKTLNFNILKLDTPQNISHGPIITSIQTSVGSNGISSTYSFRTYTRKLGLYNKEESDRIKKNFSQNFQRNKQLSELSQQFRNVTFQQKKFIDDQRLEKAQFGNKSDFKSKLMGWSPSTVLIGQAIPYLYEPLRSPIRESQYGLYSDPGPLDSFTTPVSAWTIPSGEDPGEALGNRKPDALNNDNVAITGVSDHARVKTSVGLYERKEVDAQLANQYASQSVMSLDGLLSPISFYPTKQHATFNFSLYDTDLCPFCDGTKKRTTTLNKYKNDGTTEQISVSSVCDKCTYYKDKLNAKLKGFNSSTKKGSEILPPYIISSGTDFTTLLNFSVSSDILSSSSTSSSASVSPTASNIPINLVTLNPIVVPYGEFKNSNTQPDDRKKHCIEIIGRGSILPTTYKYKLETSKNLTAFVKNADKSNVNYDYSHYDLMLAYYTEKIGGINNKVLVENNQRFFGLRGPLIIHGWGYDKDGYPVPNEADEPLSVDSLGRPLRFKVIKKQETNPVQYKSLKFGESYVKYKDGLKDDWRIFTKTFNGENDTIWQSQSPNTYVWKVTIEDDLKSLGGYDPDEGYTGSIVSKTQKFTPTDPNNAFVGQWTEKIRTKNFYRNWAERPDLWPVGPVDLRWDSDRNVWSIDAGGASSYKFVYITLEEDLIREKDFDETYPARGFLDDLEYASEILPQNYRRLVYIKDKAGYTAPRGVKLLCRYNSDSGFYEPISKPVIIAVGKLVNANTASIQMNYVQGRKSGSIPTMNVAFDNSQFNFKIEAGKNGMFTFLDGKWVLTSIQAS